MDQTLHSSGGRRK